MQKVIGINSFLCIDCGSCESACYSRFYEKRLHRNYPCKHCSSPPCVIVCPTGALRKQNGVVYLHKFLCVGCKSCVFACPFGVLEDFVNKGSIQKCDLCKDEGMPKCVESCPTSALFLKNEEKI